FFFFSSRRRHTRFSRDWSSDVCSSDLGVSRRVFDAHVLEPDARQLVACPLGSLPHIVFVLRQRTDARNGQIFSQLANVAIAVGVDEVDDVVHGSSSQSVSSEFSTHQFLVSLDFRGELLAIPPFLPRAKI